MIPLRLGVNIDHVATLRNARGTQYPDPLRAARVAREAGADIITVHLREDRRHIRADDVARISAAQDLPLNLEMAATAEVLEVATRVRPQACCIVPERREEVTTEGGLDVAGQFQPLRAIVERLDKAGIRVALFIAPEAAQIAAAAELGVQDVELHTGAYCEAYAEHGAAAAANQLDLLRDAARISAGKGLEVHAGHGLSYENVAPIAAIPEIVELQIGHFLIGESVFVGLAPAIRRMREIVDRARIAR